MSGGQDTSKDTSKTSGTTETLADLRREIDAIDEKLVHLLASRLEVVQRVVKVKNRDGLPANIPERVEEVVASACRRAEIEGLPPELAELIWRDMVAWIIDYENQHLTTDKRG
ncbi:chorismate mutase [Labrys portucalensis]|uniref:chorismate mutase n=1 Tax=Labrys neptuniae TaxID=376174 RepID=A0ABV6Z9G6_9HYPH|nr:chorismate mutase [Labrys neptuniae]MDT3377495.1 chorismate mutase [Labrys neptuniae]